MIVIKIIAGVVLGGGAGFLLYRFVGCSTGTCPMTSNPYVSTLIGAAVGVLMAIGK